MTVDGASFNNSFGLSSALGAQGTEPYLARIDRAGAGDDRSLRRAQRRLHGAGGINSVTKSGTDEWHASAYMYTKSPELQGRRVRDYVGQVSEFSNRQYGVSLSGPIVKNKLFFFVNGELDRQDEPISNRLARFACLGRRSGRSGQVSRRSAQRQSGRLRSVRRPRRGPIVLRRVSTGISTIGIPSR